MKNVILTAQKSTQKYKMIVVENFQYVSPRQVSESFT